VLAKVEKDRQIMKIIQQRQHHWIGHILRYQSLLLDTVEGCIKGRPLRPKGEKRTMQMIYMLAKDDYMALKR